MPVAVIPPSRLGTVVVDVPIVHCVDADSFERVHLPIKGCPRVGIVDCHEAMIPEPRAAAGRNALSCRCREARNCRWAGGSALDVEHRCCDGVPLDDVARLRGGGLGLPNDGQDVCAALVESGLDRHSVTRARCLDEVHRPTFERDFLERLSRRKRPQRC